MKRSWAIILIILSAVASLFYPIATYLSTLSLFGVAHVFIELRYIDAKYFTFLKKQVNVSFIFWLVNLLLAIAALRCLILLNWLPHSIGLGLELCCGLGLVLLAARVLWQQIKVVDSLEIIVRLGVTLAIATLLVLGIVQSPITTLVILAILHNLTPIGFIYHHPNRHHFHWFGCIFMFGVLPLLIFCGRWLAVSWYSSPIMTSYYMATFVPPALQHSQFAEPLFAAVTFCQCMHYLVVLGLFSEWTPSNSDSLIPWMCPQWFYLAVLFVSTLFLFAFQTSFFTTRAFYSVLASIHAWVEIPLLLVLLTPKHLKYQFSKE
jgi:hypothetical protein